MDKLRQPSDDDRPSLNALLAQAADLQQQYERDVEQAAAEHDRYDAAERDLIEFIRKHRDIVDIADVECNDGRRFWFEPERHGVIVEFPADDERDYIVPLDAPGDR